MACQNNSENRDCAKQTNKQPTQKEAHCIYEESSTIVIVSVSTFPKITQTVNARAYIWTHTF